MKSMCVGRTREQGLDVTDTFLAFFDSGFHSSACGKVLAQVWRWLTRHIMPLSMPYRWAQLQMLRQSEILRARGRREGGGEVPPEKLGRGVRLTSQNPYPTKDQNLRFSLSYLWPDQKFDTLFKTWPLNRYPVSDCVIICSLVHTNVKTM